MKKTLIAILISAVAAGLSSPAEGQGKTGDNEISFLGSFTKLTEGDSDGFLTANARIGHFFTDALVVGFGVSVGGEIDDIDESVDGEVFAIYHFSPGQLRTWYVRGGYFSPLDEPGDGFLDGAFGFKAYLDEDKAFFWEAAYGVAISSSVDGGVIRSVAGLTFVF